MELHPTLLNCLFVLLPPREVSPSAPAVTEMEAAESESSVVSQPPPGTEPENPEGCTDEVRPPKKGEGWGWVGAVVGLGVGVGRPVLRSD